MDLAGAAWRKSSRSGSNGCVEVAFVGDQVAIRDSKHRSGPVLIFSATEFQALLTGIGHGEFDVAPGAARPKAD